MIDAVEQMIRKLAVTLQRAGLWWGLAISIGVGVVSLILATIIVIGWSPDHFRRGAERFLWKDSHPMVRVLGIGAKNLAGLVLLVLGLVMSLPGIPGQGILTMIIGLTLLDLPGKRRIERSLIGRPRVLKRLNALRARFRRPPLVVE